MPAFPNLLRSRYGRLAGFFALYVSEGLPQGFTGVAVALEFKRMGMTGEAIGTFLAIIMLPWGWKWIVGPLVDNFHLKRFGRRKQWIIATQLGMLATLAAALYYFPTAAGDPGGSHRVIGLALFSAILLAHNCFAACQDVAIDALACDTLPEEERGAVNGLMFAGAQVGAAIGGSGVLYLKGALGFSTASLIAPLLLLGLLVMVALTIFEKRVEQAAQASGRNETTLATGESGPKWRSALVYLAMVLHVFFRTRRGFLGLILAIIPFGGMALSLTVSTVITPTLGMTDPEIATLGLACSLVFTVCCIAGGFLSDRIGRRRSLVLFSLGTLIPTIWMGWTLASAGWIHPAPALPNGHWPRHESLITAWWIAGLAYSLFNGLMYGIRTAFVMDIIEPKIAATQFTACMALMNLVTIYSYWWEGKAITAAVDGGWGFTYAQIFYLDAALGAVFVIPLWLVGGKRQTTDPAELACGEPAAPFP